MGNGLIFAFVVALWAAYFVPLAVRRYDEASKSGSIDKFSSLSRVIPHKRLVTEEVEEDAAPEVEIVAPEPEFVAPPAKTLTRASARIAARRRRRTLLTLLASAVIVAGFAFVAMIPMWSTGIPAALIVAWLVACRIQVRDERGISSRKSSAKTNAVKDAYDAEATVIISGQFEDIEPDRKHVMEKVPLEANALDEQLVIAVPAIATTGEAMWHPLPVTLPTYVTKPRAGRTVRTIDFNEAGAWTSGHIEGEEVELPSRKDDGDGEHRKAVGH
ncbi:MAG: hypothetical protein ABIR57_10380 [Aeromicrobium sp.]